MLTAIAKDGGGLLFAEASAISNRANANAAVEYAFTTAINAAWAKGQHQDVAAGNLKAHALNAAAETQIEKDAAADATFQHKLSAAAEQEIIADTAAAVIEVKALNQLSAQQTKDDAQAADEFNSTVAQPAADKQIAYDKAALDSADRQYKARKTETLALDDAYISGLSDWASNNKSAESTRDLAIAQANRTFDSDGLAAYGLRLAGQSKALTNYNAAVLPAVATLETAISTADLQYVNNVAGEMKTCIDTLADNSQEWITTMAPAARQAVDKKVENAKKWVDSVVPAARVLADQESDIAESSATFIAVSLVLAVDAINNHAKSEIQQEGQRLIDFAISFGDALNAWAIALEAEIPQSTTPPAITGYSIAQAPPVDNIFPPDYNPDKAYLDRVTKVKTTVGTMPSWWSSKASVD